MKVTLYEIAQKAGVSISTVSRVLNDDKKKPASKATREKILKIAYETKYITKEPSAPALNSTVSERKILCLLSNIAYNYSDYFYSQIFHGIQEESAYYQWRLMQQISAVDLEKESLRKEISDENIDGIILLGRWKKKNIDFIQSCTSNIVYAGLNKLENEIDQVICDTYTAVNAMIDYLVSCGHSHIGFIGVIDKENVSELNEHRFTAYCDALSRHHISLDMRLCKNSELTSEDAYQATMELIKENSLPDALFCSTDICAIAAISALRSQGIRVPEDISVVGHDNIDLSEFTEPKLTTINMQKSDLGKFAVKLLNDRITNRHTLPVTINLPYRLELRESCINLTSTK